MVVTGLHLLGGARADATRVRSGAARAVVEGRFTTTELGDGVATRVDDVLESSGADRDDDGSVIAARSVSRDGPSRAYLGGRSVPAKSLSTFTTELLALHGSERPTTADAARRAAGALDRFVDVESQLSAIVGCATTGSRPAGIWLTATDGRASLAQEADRLKFGLNEIDTVAPEPSEDATLVDDIRRLSELDALREAAQTARAALSGLNDDEPVHRVGVGRRRCRAREVDVGGHR